MKRAVLYMRVSTFDQRPRPSSTIFGRWRLSVATRSSRVYGPDLRRQRPGPVSMSCCMTPASIASTWCWSGPSIGSPGRFATSSKCSTNSTTSTSSSSHSERMSTPADRLGRAMVVIVAAIAELERNLIIERVRAGMRRARLEGRQIGRRPLEIDRTGVVRDRASGMSLAEVAMDPTIG